MYDFANNGSAVNTDWNNGKMYFGHHWRVEFDILYNPAISSSGTFFDVGSVASAGCAFGIGLTSTSS
jgi:hypothetical protein